MALVAWQSVYRGRLGGTGLEELAPTRYSK